MLQKIKLINLAKEKGYEILFKPHPEINNIIDLFNTENIKIAKNETYQELFNSSSLLITDYSSVFFDFAYLKKPVIYYQGNEEYHYNKGYWDYNTMGFGEVISKEEDIVNKIIDYIDNDCNMEEEYKKRVDKFFKFTDKNNCKRVYEWILHH